MSAKVLLTAAIEHTAGRASFQGYSLLEVLVTLVYRWSQVKGPD